jgi:hypothetical protein
VVTPVPNSYLLEDAVPRKVVGMNRRTLRRVSISTLVLSAAIWASWTLWMRTRRWVPVEVPFSVVAGSKTQTPEFNVNLSGVYAIEVQVRGSNEVPFYRLVCMLGSHPLWPKKSCDVSPVVKTSWELSSSGRTLATGSSADSTGVATAEGSSLAWLNLGRFPARRGQHLRVTVHTLEDASGLSSTRPILRVSSDHTSYESALVATGIINVLCGMSILASFVLLLVSLKA